MKMNLEEALGKLKQKQNIGNAVETLEEQRMKMIQKLQENDPTLSFSTARAKASEMLFDTLLALFRTRA